VGATVVGATVVGATVVGAADHDKGVGHTRTARRRGDQIKTKLTDVPMVTTNT